MQLIRHPFIRYTNSFLARLAFAGMWGVVLSDAELNLKLIFGVLLAFVACVLMTLWLGYAPRWRHAPLYGLLFAGEAMATGAFVQAFLGAGTGHVSVALLTIMTFGGIFFINFPVLLIVQSMSRDNTGKRRDQSQG